MQFAYQDYRWGLLILPAFFGAIAVLGLFLSVRSLVRTWFAMASSNLTVGKRLRTVFPPMFFVMIAFFLVIIELHSLQYGKDLFAERPEAVVTYTGRVTSIAKDGLSPRFYDADGNVVSASVVRIGDADYYVMDANGLTVGDIVQVTCPSNSPVVLKYCAENAADCTDSDQNFEPKPTQDTTGIRLLLLFLGMVFVAFIASQGMHSRRRAK